MLEPKRRVRNRPSRAHTVTDLAQGFDAAAARYDTMVGLNPGYRRHLRLAAEAVVARVTEPSPTLLDLGCGSGLSTRALLDAAVSRGLTPQIIGVDASAGMLARARAKPWPSSVRFVEGRGEALPDLGLPPAHGALACYLLRNVPDLPATLAGVRCSLLPGSPFVAEDYSVRDDPAAARRWSRVNRAAILPLATVITGDVALYRYLHASVDEFMGVAALTQAFVDAGFTGVHHRTVDGWQRGILHLVRGATGRQPGSQTTRNPRSW